MVDALITGVPLDPPREEPLAPWRTRLSALPAPADDRAPFTPRNAAIYRLIKERYPEFRWEARRRVDSVKRRETGELIAIERRWVEFKNTPTIGALLPSLASLLVATIASDEPTPHEARKIAHCSEFRRGEDLARLLLEIGAVFPPDDVLRLVGAWWEAGLSGAPLVVFTPVCPDYAVEPTGDPELPYEYTFDSLGADVGLVARRIRAELPRLAKTFRDVGISVEFVVAIGDFEAGSPETLARVGLTRETFLARLAESQDRLRDTTTAPVTTPFITALCGEAAWSATVEEIHRRLRAGDFGAMPLVSPRRDLRHIVKARRRLYSR